MTGGPGTVYGTGVRVDEVLTLRIPARSIVTPCFTPERCLTSGVFDPYEDGTTMPLGPSDVPRYGVSVPGHSHDLSEANSTVPSLSPQCPAEPRHLRLYDQQYPQ